MLIDRNKLYALGEAQRNEEKTVPIRKSERFSQGRRIFQYYYNENWTINIRISRFFTSDKKS